MNRERSQTILKLALPIMGGMVSQNVMNLVDTAMVGSLGEAALAAVGLSSFATFMAQAFLVGLSSGVQAMAARRHGEARTGELAVPLNGGLLLALVIGVPLSIILFWAAPHLYPYLNSDPGVIAEGVPYLQARLCAVTAVGFNFSFRGYFNGVNRSQIYLRSLLVMHACNIVLSYALIFGELGLPRLGATGAGIGTAAATYIGTGTYCVMALRHARSAGFLRGLPDRSTLRSMLQQAVPSGIRQVFFASGLTALSWIVGLVGRTELAAANVIVNVMLVAILPAMGLGLAATSLVGQALGRKDVPDARRWGWDVTRIALVIIGLIGLPMLLFPEAILWVFARNQPETIAVGVLPLRIVGASIALDGIGLVLQNAMLGAGDSRRVMIAAIVLQWGLFLPTAYLVGPLLGYGLLGIWIAMAGQRVVQAGWFSLMWRGTRWAQIEL